MIKNANSWKTKGFKRKQTNSKPQIADSTNQAYSNKLKKIKKNKLKGDDQIDIPIHGTDFI